MRKIVLKNVPSPHQAARWLETKRIHGVLVALYPDLFSLEHPRPLKVGITDDLKAEFPAISVTRLRRVMSWLTCRRAYLAALSRGEPRWGLDGPAGDVDPEHAAFAVEKFEYRNQRAKDKWPSINIPPAMQAGAGHVG